MMSSIAKVARIRAELALLRAAVASPEPSAMAEVLPRLQEAMNALSDASGGSGAQIELLALHSELRRTSLMIQNGRLVGENTGYTPFGEPAPSQPFASRFAEQG